MEGEGTCVSGLQGMEAVDFCLVMLGLLVLFS